MANRPQSLSKGQLQEVLSIFHRKLLAYILTALAIIGGVLGVGLWQIKVRLEQKMEAMIESQFQEPRIKKTVSEVAATKAQDLMIKQLQPEVDAFKVAIAKKATEADEKLSDIQQSVINASSSLSELEIMSEYMMTNLAANNDERMAFDKLEVWSKDETHRFRAEAKRAWISILDAHNSKLVMSPGKVPWKEDIDPSKFSLSDLKNQYMATSNWLKPAMLKYIWEREDFPKLERLDFMMTVMKSESSLKAVEQAGRYFTSGTEQKIKPLAVTHLSEWWQEHRQEFEQQKEKETQQKH